MIYLFKINLFKHKKIYYIQKQKKFSYQFLFYENSSSYKVKGQWQILYGSWPKNVQLFSVLKYISAEMPYRMQHFPARIFMGKLKIILMYFPIWIFFIIPKFQTLKLINFFQPHFPIKRLNKSCFKYIQKSNSEGLLDEHRWTRF